MRFRPAKRKPSAVITAASWHEEQEWAGFVGLVADAASKHGGSACFDVIRATMPVLHPGLSPSADTVAYILVRAIEAGYVEVVP